MRIAMVGCRGIPARMGGAERVVEALTEELVPRGHEVIVYGRNGYVDPGHNGNGNGGAKVVVTGGVACKHLDAITHTATAMWDMLSRDVDVVHIHSPGPALLSWVPRFASKPIVLTIHAPDWLRDKWSLPARSVILAGLSCGMRLASAVTAVSPSLSSQLSQRYRRDVEYIPNAVGRCEPCSPDQIVRWSLIPDQYALYVGRIVPEKRLDLLLRTWARVGGGRKLVVAGCGPGRYAEQCRQLAGEDVLMVGPQYGQTLAELYSNAAVVIQPSALEGMSLVLLEAAGYGRCIIAAKIPANVDTMGDSILYFHQDNLEDLAALIGRCMADESLRGRMGQQARAYVQAHYSWSACADRMEHIYLEVCKP